MKLVSKQKSGEVIRIKDIDTHNLNIVIYRADNGYNDLKGIWDIENIPLSITETVSGNNNLSEYLTKLAVKSIKLVYPDMQETSNDNDRNWLHTQRPFRIIVKRQLTYEAFTDKNKPAAQYYLLGNLIDYINNSPTIPNDKGKKYSICYLEEFLDMPSLGMTGSQIKDFLNSYAPDVIVEDL